MVLGETELKILGYLLENKRVIVSDIADGIKASIFTTSQSLALLNKKKLVGVGENKDKRKKLYSVNLTNLDKYFKRAHIIKVYKQLVEIKCE